MLYQQEYYDAKLIIDLGAIQKNYLTLKSFLSPEVECAAVVKANAYGVGASEVTKALVKVGCKNFFVATVCEGKDLREQLYQQKTAKEEIDRIINIYVLHGLQPGQENICFENDLIPVLNSIAQIETWNEFAKVKEKKLPCILSLDTGMTRLGLNQEDIKYFMDQIEHYDLLDVKYILSHLASAEEVENSYNNTQLENYNLFSEYFKDVKKTFSNSAAIFLGEKYHFDMVRIGKGLYGPNTVYSIADKNLIQAITVKAKILQIRECTQDSYVGYNSTYLAPRGTKIATLGIGYYDGYMRACGNYGKCAIDGHIVPVIGRVSMDLVTIDVTHMAEDIVYVGKEVEILGPTVDFSMVSESSGISSYEFLVRICNSHRLSREYIEGESLCY